jgi:monoamine oxidase
MENVIIIGAGLSGLTTAHNLKKKNISFKIIEAQNESGGRVKTINGRLDTPMDLGATWFNDAHTHLITLLNDLEIEAFHQHSEGKTIFQTKSFEPPQIFYVPGSEQSSYRIKGGTFAIIEKLQNSIGKENILLNTSITKMIDAGDFVTLVDGKGKHYEARQIISTIPPQLLIDKIAFVPLLPTEISDVMQNVQTWMSGSIKFSLEYDEPFWLQNQFSGTIFSQSGIAVEVYDHANFEQSKFSLIGFLNGSAVNYDATQREQLVVAQIETLFGSIVKKHISYHDKVWDNEFIATGKTTNLFPHKNNGHPVLQKPLLGGKLFLAGTETSKTNAGYLDGAVVSANRVTRQIIEK